MNPQAAQTQREHATVQILGALQPPGLYPPLLTIHPLDYVTFINQAVPATTYTIAAIDGSFVSPHLAPGQQWTVTFSDLGAHEYDATSSPQLVIGEILVVANSVSLLPTPVPQVEATVLAYIRAGRLLLTMWRCSHHHRYQNNPQQTQGAPSILLILGSILILLGLVVGGFFYFRHFHRPPQESIGETIAVLASAAAGLFKNLLQRLKRRKGRGRRRRRR